MVYHVFFDDEKTGKIIKKVRSCFDDVMKDMKDSNYITYLPSTIWNGGN